MIMLANLLMLALFIPQEQGELKQVETGLNGYCPVQINHSDKTKRDWVKGDAKFYSDFDELRYFFSSEEHKEKFDAYPEKYIPALGGLCVVCVRDHAIYSYGSVNFAARHNDRLFLFPSEVTRRRFLADTETYGDFDIAYGGQCIVSKSKGETKQGKPELVAIKDGLRFFFTNEENKQLFMTDPDSFLSSASKSN